MSFGRNLFLFLCVVTLCCLIFPGLAGSSHAAETEWVTKAHSQARLIVDHDVMGPEASVRLGLQLRLQPGWHSYWVNPGAAGDAPHLELKASGRTLVQQGPVQWPVPRLLKEGDLSAYAYEGTVLLPQSLTVAGEGAVTFSAHADWLVCASICVPEQADFTLSIPSGDHAVINPEADRLFEQAEQLLPQPALFQATLSAKDVLTIRSDTFSEETVKDAYFFPAKTGLIDPNAEQKLHIGKGVLTLSLTPDSLLKKNLAQEKLEGVLTVTDPHGQTASVWLTTQEDNSSSSGSAGSDNVALVLLLAFLGGVILNAMPCVFPVLAMKSLSLVALKGAERRERQKSAFYYTVGILGSFTALGGVFLSLRLLGSTVGWGFQFQSPIFVGVMCWILLLLALNLCDVFYIGLGRAGSAIDQAVQAKRGPAWGHDILTGFLAVLVATPCTAPFMGVAIAAALSRSVFTGLAIFAIMGLGLAFPYIILANIPALARALPRSGSWMEIFRRFLAFPLLASCVWLLWVGTLQAGADFVITVAGGGVFLSLAAWLYGLAQKNRMLDKNKRLNILNYAVILLLLALSAGLLLVYLPSHHAAGGALKGSQPRSDHLPEGWEVFSQERLQQLQTEGKAVFVDMTASWCITCLVNERVALKNPSVLRAFRQHNVTVLVGDWTQRNEAITRYLRDHGRDGVPLYVYYPAGKKDVGKKDFYGEILPQILTPSLILTTLGKLSP
ncbi:protein-disulfide reductase DsbD family protein [Acetobacteraceae bacterium ESL0709]|nr:protein-disulfide reductase DsbD family protein [Acetobacteraceae bacterium ESL0697]MDF7678943.1 protein-disulfide reductase DsbD family protein [Acetobacteraceae bacterium ESL0709]